MELSNKSLNVLRIPTRLDSDLFKRWFQFLQPYHGLTEREMQVAGEYVFKRYMLLKKFKDASKVDSLLQHEEIRSQIREASGVTPAHYQVILGKLRKAKVLDGNALNPKFMPNIAEEEGMFKLLMVFDFRK